MEAGSVERCACGRAFLLCPTCGEHTCLECENWRRYHSFAGWAERMFWRAFSAGKRWSGIAAVWLCWALDAIPSYSQGRWYRHGQWGCRIGLGTYWGHTVTDAWDEDDGYGKGHAVRGH